MIRKSLKLIIVAAIFTFASVLATNAQTTSVEGKYVYMYENTTDEGGVALILTDKKVAVWKNIEDGEGGRYERQGTWKLSDNQKNLMISFQKDPARNDFQSDPFEISF